jgi:hypothetical protein
MSKCPFTLALGMILIATGILSLMRVAFLTYPYDPAPIEY